MKNEMPKELTETLLRDVKRYSLNMLAIEMFETPHGGWVKLHDVEAALTLPDMDDAGKVAAECLDAVSGNGPRAYEWSDKPHRLVYALHSTITALLAQRAADAARIRGLEATVERFARAHERHLVAGAEAREQAEARIAALEAQVERMREAGKRVLEPLNEPCRHDHHGYCQSHFIEADCSVAALRAAITEETHEPT